MSLAGRKLFRSTKTTIGVENFTQFDKTLKVLKGFLQTTLFQRVYGSDSVNYRFQYPFREHYLNATYLLTASDI